MTLKADNAGLTALTLSGNDQNRHILVDHGGAFGPAGTAVGMSNAILGIGALTTESIGLASGAVNGSGESSTTGAITGTWTPEPLGGKVSITGNNAPTPSPRRSAAGNLFAAPSPAHDSPARQ